MGGQGVKVEEHPRIALCRDCHNAVHAGEFALEIEGEIVRGKGGEIVQFERALWPDDDATDSRYWSDEKLAGQWAQADGAVRLALQVHAHLSYELWRRYGWTEKWYSRAAELISDQVGYHVDWRRIYEGVRLWMAFGERNWQHVERLGTKLALAVAETEEPEQAMAVAVEGLENGRTRKEIMSELRGDGLRPAETCECPSCGNEHRRRDG